MKIFFIKFFAIITGLLLPIYFYFSKTNEATISGLLGAAIGALASYFSIREQLKDARSQNKEERDATLKRGIYLDAVNSFAAMQEILVKIGKVGFENIDTTLVQQAHIMRLHFIASPALIKKLTACQKYFAEACMDLGFDKMTIQLSNESDLKKLEKQMQLTKRTIESSSQFSQLLCNCIIDIRHELGQPFSAQDAQDYNNTMKQAGSESVEKVNEFIVRLRNQI